MRACCIRFYDSDNQQSVLNFISTKESSEIQLRNCGDWLGCQCIEILETQINHHTLKSTSKSMVRLTPSLGEMLL